MRVAKWGNSLAIRVPAVAAATLNLKEGDHVELVAVGPSRFEIVRNPRVEAALARIEALRVPFPSDYRFDREEANARGPE